MLVGAEESVRLVRIHRGAVEEAQYAAHFLIQLLGGVFALLYSFYIRCGEVVIVVGIAGSPREAIGPGAKLHVKPILYGLVSIVGSTPQSLTTTPSNFQSPFSILLSVHWLWQLLL